MPTQAEINKALLDNLNEELASGKPVTRYGNSDEAEKKAKKIIKSRGSSNNNNNNNNNSNNNNNNNSNNNNNNNLNNNVIKNNNNNNKDETKSNFQRQKILYEQRVRQSLKPVYDETGDIIGIQDNRRFPMGQNDLSMMGYTKITKTEKGTTTSKQVFDINDINKANIELSKTSSKNSNKQKSFYEDPKNRNAKDYVNRLIDTSNAKIEAKNKEMYEKNRQANIGRVTITEKNKDYKWFPEGYSFPNTYPIPNYPGVISGQTRKIKDFLDMTEFSNNDAKTTLLRGVAGVGYFGAKIGEAVLDSPYYVGKIAWTLVSDVPRAQRDFLRLTPNERKDKIDSIASVAPFAITMGAVEVFSTLKKNLKDDPIGSLGYTIGTIASPKIITETFEQFGKANVKIQGLLDKKLASRPFYVEAIEQGSEIHKGSGFDQFLLKYKGETFERQGKLFGVRRVQSPSIRNPSSIIDWVKGYKTGQIRYFDSVAGDFILRDVPSEFASPMTELALSTASKKTITTVTPDARFLTKSLKDSGKYTSLYAGGQPIETISGRSGVGGIELGQFFSAPTTKNIANVPKGTPQVYIYYAGMSEYDDVLPSKFVLVKPNPGVLVQQEAITGISNINRPYVQLAQDLAGYTEPGNIKLSASTLKNVRSELEVIKPGQTITRLSLSSNINIPGKSSPIKLFYGSDAPLTKTQYISALDNNINYLNQRINEVKNLIELDPTLSNKGEAIIKRELINIQKIENAKNIVTGSSSNLIVENVDMSDDLIKSLEGADDIFKDKGLSTFRESSSYKYVSSTDIISSISPAGNKLVDFSSSNNIILSNENNMFVSSKNNIYDGENSVISVSSPSLSMKSSFVISSSALKGNSRSKSLSSSSSSVSSSSASSSISKSISSISSSPEISSSGSKGSIISSISGSNSSVSSSISSGSSKMSSSIMSSIVSQPLQSKTSGLFSNNRSSKNNLVSGFDVFVKRKGKFVRVSNVPLSYGDAFKKGSSIVGNTSSATFKIKMSNNKVSKLGSFFGNDNNFDDFYTKNDKDNLLFIQKRSKRISSAGEKREITYKGLQVLREKGRKNNLGFSFKRVI